MLAVIFEVTVKNGCQPRYLNLAQALRGKLEMAEGFISIERFQSLSNPDKILSLSFWHDEQALTVWRNLELHRSAQSEGRDDLFEDYRIRIVSVIRDYGIDDRAEAPEDSRLWHGKRLS